MKSKKCTSTIVLGWIIIAIVITIFHKGILDDYVISEISLYFENQNYYAGFGRLSYPIFFFIFTFVAFVFSIKLNSFIEEIEKKLNSSDYEIGIFKDIWESYRKTFLKDLNKTRTNADLYFNSEELCSSNFKFPILPVFKLISGTFVGLGILGTFIGFTSGLPTNTAINDIKDLNPLFEGLKTAFNTSIIGVFTSVLYNFFIVQPITKSLNSVSKKISDELDSKYFITDTDAIFDMSNKIENASKDNSKQIETLTFYLKEETDKINEKLEKSNSSIASMTESVLLNFADLKESLGNIFNGISGMNNSIESTLKGVVENTNELAEKFTSGAEKAISNAVEQGRTALNASLLEAAEKLTKISEILDKTPEIMNSVNESTEKMNEQLQESLKEATEQTKVQLETVVATINTELNEKFEHFAESLIPTSETMNDIADKISVIPTYINDSQKEFLDGEKKLVTSFYNTTVDLKNNLKEMISKIGKDASCKIDSIYSDFYTCISELTEALNPASENLKRFGALIQDIPGTIKEIQLDFKSTENEVANRMKDTANTLSSSLTTVTSAFDNNLSQLNQTLIKLDSAQTQLQDLINDSKENENQIRENLNKAISYTQNLFNDFKDVDNALSAVFNSIENSMQNYTTNTNANINKFMNGFANGTKNYTDTFLSSVEEIEKISERIEKMMESIFMAQNQIKNLPNIVKNTLDNIPLNSNPTNNGGKN